MIDKKNEKCYNKVKLEEKICLEERVLIMKRKLITSVLLIAVMVLGMATSSFAAGLDVESGVVKPSVTVENRIKEGDFVSLLVVEANADLANLRDEQILFIDQKTAGEDGKVSFKVSLPQGTVVDIYSGFSSMTGSDDPLSNEGYTITTVSYNVVFKNADGSVVSSESVIDGQTVTALPQPTVIPVGKGFDNWYLGEDIFTADTEVTADITVTAKLFKYGNVDDDEEEVIDAFDLLDLAVYVASSATGEYDPNGALTLRQFKAADMASGHDGVLDAFDLLELAVYVANNLYLK